MKREQIEELWDNAVQDDENYKAIESCVHHEGVADMEEVRNVTAVKFAELILFEAAKMACIGCKKYGPALENRGMKFHTTQGASGYVHNEPCRAPQFYLEA